MKNCPSAVLACMFFATLACTGSAQAPAVPVGTSPRQPAAQGARLSAKDVQEFPFVHEFKEKKFKRNERGVPDELRVTTVGDRVHITGKKKSDAVPRLGEKSAGHTGKLALFPAVDGSGTMDVKFPTTDDVRYYCLVLELADGSLESKDVRLEAGKTYEWSLKSDGGQTTLRIAAGGTEVGSVTAPKEKVKGAGFAVTVRSKGNEVDVTIAFNK